MYKCEKIEYTIDMSRENMENTHYTNRKEFVALLRLVWVILPASIVAIFAMMVLFGEQGLLSLERYTLELEAIERQTQSVQEKNMELQIQIRRLRNRPTQVEFLTAKELGQSTTGATIYRFSK